ncbi:AAA family ATPase (plasmid) [Streptomyces sp. NBC_01450]|uniref:AAA family ATPase n=1 Tax=Streptomyces sp. NBC_01450 TaxID=2903871 RepID=UPI002E35F4CA|nr:AAA family ATPase [Streptomyces sp. NBC_01450]
MAGLLRGWLDEARLTGADLSARLVPEHFASGSSPGRTTLYERLAGQGMEWDFVEAVADVVSATAQERERRLARARALWQQPSEPELTGADGQLPVRAVSELVVQQRRSLELADQLRRAELRSAELERVRDRAQQLTMVLLMMSEQIRHTVLTLRVQSGRARGGSADASQSSWGEQLRRSERERARAEAERDRAQNLLEEQTARIMQLIEALAMVRETQISSVLESAPWLRAPWPFVRMDGPSLDDIDLALQTAEQRLDTNAEDLDRYTEEMAADTTLPTVPRARHEGFITAIMLGRVPDPTETKGFRFAEPFVWSLQRGITLEAGISLFVGPNGSGKTMLLEAIAVVTGCRYVNGGYEAEVRASSRILAQCLEIEQRGHDRFRGGLFVSHLGSAPLGENSAQEHLGHSDTLFLLDEPLAGLSQRRAQEFMNWATERVAEGCQIIITGTDAGRLPSGAHMLEFTAETGVRTL